MSSFRTLLFIVGIMGFSAAALAQVGRYHPSQYKRKEFKTAYNYLAVPFLRPEREWERIDIYVPKDAKEKKLPCVVLFYGGGWGGKNMGGVAREIEPLLQKGYVVAVPDYVLGATHPVPLAVWDGANAIRFLRAHAVKYQIDPERIGVWGFSAGGWLVQYLGPSDSQTLAVCQNRDRKTNQRIWFHVPMLEPRPLYPNYSAEVQALVTDWGAGRLKEDRMHKYNPNWLSSDDPPLLTCHNDPTGKFPLGPEMYLQAGIPTEVAYMKVKNTHVPSTQTPTVDKSGKKVTWRERIHLFFDEYVKNPQIATPPEFFPHGGAFVKEISVRMQSVHPDAVIHYTTDGSKPTSSSPVYKKPLTVEPGTTLQAIAVKRGLKPSRVTGARFVKASVKVPVIATQKQIYTAKVKQPFSVPFQANSESPVRWFLAGKLGDINPKSRPPREVPWLKINEKTGELTGTPTQKGVYPFIVTANVQDGEKVLCDAEVVIVRVEE